MPTPAILRAAAENIAITYAEYQATDKLHYSCIAVERAERDAGQCDWGAAEAWKTLAWAVYGGKPLWWSNPGPWNDTWQRERIALLREAADYLEAQNAHT